MKAELNQFSKTVATSLKNRYAKKYLHKKIFPKQSSYNRLLFVLILILGYAIYEVFRRYKEELTNLSVLEYCGAAGIVISFCVLMSAYKTMRLKFRFRKISFSLIQFLETDHDTDFPYGVISTISTDGKKRFSYVNFSDFPELNKGDIAISVYSKSGGCLGVIHLKNQGKLAFTDLVNDSYHEEFLPKMSDELKATVDKFSSLCKKFQEQ